MEIAVRGLVGAAKDHLDIVDHPFGKASFAEGEIINPLAQEFFAVAQLLQFIAVFEDVVAPMAQRGGIVLADGFEI